MPGTVIITSPNISYLASKTIANVCAGQFIIDASPSTFIGAGAANVLGIKVQITNPYGVVIKSYGSTYNIVPPNTGNFSYNIPTQAGKYQFGIYNISLELTDADNAKYYSTQTVNVCSYTKDNYPCDERLQLIASCKNGTLTILVAEPPVFKGQYAQSKTQEWTLDYPTASGLEPLVSTNSNWSVQLFPGVYKISGTVCATYNMGDNFLLSLPYNATVEKNVKCVLDYSCIYPRIAQLNENLNNDCSEAQKQYYISLTFDALRYLRFAELANEAGEDASPYIVELEKLLGCTCSCDCSGSPIVNGTPATNVSIEGCGVEVSTVGLTTVYTINNYEYSLTPDEGSTFITISAPSFDGCEKTQEVSFNLPAFYTELKELVISSSDYDFWASIVNTSLNGIVATCLGYNTSQWNALTFKQKIAALVSAACAGGVCTASTTTPVATQMGSNVELSWTQTGGFSTDIYVDGVLVGSTLAATGEILLSGYGDGNQHTYIVVPRCSNGSNGVGGTGTFFFISCPSISPPVVSSNNVNGVECPYDLTALVTPPPMGITTEWHTANNTNSNSLVPDPENVSSGVYYAFSKNSAGCFSTSTQVTVICEAESSCTAPQGLLVTNGLSSFAAVSFDSAAFPPPANSYTVKRKLASDPDIDASYTTLTTPFYDAGSNKWLVVDVVPANNTLYTYKAISNCSSSAPAVYYTFAKFTCPVLTLTPGDTTLGYSFVSVGGGISKYEVNLYDASGVTLLYTQTILPAFSNPITGTFNYLTSGTTYKIQITEYIGTISNVCAAVATTTTTPGGDGWTISYTNNQNIPVRLDFGQNGGSPSNTLYNGNYTSDPVVGTSGLLPAVNAVVLLTVGAGKTILSCTCNGVSGTTGGNTSVWTAVNGSILVNFLTN